MAELISWQYCKNPNEINDAIMNNDSNWFGIAAQKIISISWDDHQGCYIVFWRVDGE